MPWLCWSAAPSCATWAYSTTSEGGAPKAISARSSVTDEAAWRAERRPGRACALARGGGGGQAGGQRVRALGGAERGRRLARGGGHRERRVDLAGLGALALAAGLQAADRLHAGGHRDLERLRVQRDVGEPAERARRVRMGGTDRGRERLDRVGQAGELLGLGRAGLAQRIGEPRVARCRSPRSRRRATRSRAPTGRAAARWRLPHRPRRAARARAADAASIASGCSSPCSRSSSVRRARASCTPSCGSSWVVTRLGG